MLNFTSQQLCGGSKYNHAVRIGNWNEDVQLEEIKLKDYLKKKEEGKLKVIARQLRLEKALQPMPASTQNTDGRLRYGDTVMVRSVASECFISANQGELVNKMGAPAFAITTGPNDNPCVRNVFKVEPPKECDYKESGLCYGDRIRLRLMNGEEGSTIYLMSDHIDPAFTGSASKHTGYQEVVAYGKADGKSIWQLLHPDTKTRFETEGELIDINDDQVCFRHTYTGSYLASDKIIHRNLFGVEYEVHCHCYYSTNKTHNLTSEERGEITGDHALRRHGNQNKWTFISNVKGMGSLATPGEPKKEVEEEEKDEPPQPERISNEAGA